MVDAIGISCPFPPAISMVAQNPKDEFDLIEEPSLGEVDFTPHGTDDFDDRFLLEEESDDADDIYRHQHSGGISDLVDEHRDMHAGLAEEIPVDKELFDPESPHLDDDQAF